MNSNLPMSAGASDDGSSPTLTRTPQTNSVTLYWLIDESGSMRMDRMSTALQAALTQGHRDLARPRPAYPQLELFIRTLCFGQTMRWNSAARAPVLDAKISELLPYGQTSVAPALRELTREIEAHASAHDEFPPIIVLFSDGLPTDDYSSALAEFDAACMAAAAVRLSVSLGRLGALEFCREFLGRSPFDCLAAATPAALSIIVEELCTSIIPACLSRASGGHAPIPLEPAHWVPHIFSHSLRAKRLSSQSFHTHCSRHAADGLSAAVVADLSVGSPGEEIFPRVIDSILADLLLEIGKSFHSQPAAPEWPLDDSRLEEARRRLRENGIHTARFSFAFAGRDRLVLTANQALEVALASETGTTVHTVDPTGSGDEAKQMDIVSHAFEVTRPGVVLVGSESLRNAFGSSQDFGAVASDLLRLSLSEEGDPKTREALSGWLQKASAANGEAIAGVVAVFAMDQRPCLVSHPNPGPLRRTL